MPGTVLHLLNMQLQMQVHLIFFPTQPTSVTSTISPGLDKAFIIKKIVSTTTVSKESSCSQIMFLIFLQSIAL